MSVTYAWLLTGVALVVAEALGISGIGLLFAGLGAIATGVAISLQYIMPDDRVMQFIVFFIATAISALVLWKPMQRFRRPSPGYSNIIGETAYVGSSGLNKDTGGEVTWSGTIMKAKLAAGGAIEKLEAGSQVTVVEVSGATLIVRPKE